MVAKGGYFVRPLTAAAAVGVAASSSNLLDRFSWSQPSESSVCSKAVDVSRSDCVEQLKSWVPRISLPNVSGLSLSSRLGLYLSKIKYPSSDVRLLASPICLANSPFSNVTSPPVLLDVYRSVHLVQSAPLIESGPGPDASSSTGALYRWHLPQLGADEVLGDSECLSAKSKTVVVLLGWLGAKQKHLKKYADWYTSMGFHVVTFTFPMSEILSYKVGGKAEENVDVLADHLANWVGEEHGKQLVFHTFSNTGWLTYGVILENFQKQDPALMERIKGCVVDSAPAACPDPQVWASGFSAAFLKKQSIATKGSSNVFRRPLQGVSEEYNATDNTKPDVAEVALLVLLEKFFEVVLNLPSVSRRLSDVLDLLSSQQPRCPQLYIYSSADRVIPVKSVESFIEEQRRAGHQVRTCNFISSPHVDHFRNAPELYTSQLTTFLEDYVLPPCKGCC